MHVVGAAAKCLFDTINKEKRGLWFETVDELKKIFISTLEGRESVFLKGSLSQRLPELVGLLKNQLIQAA